MAKLVRVGVHFLGYFLYSVTIAIILLWVLFPVDFFKQWIPEYVQGRFSPLKIEIKHADLKMTEGLKFEALKLVDASLDETLVELESFTVKPDLTGGVQVPPILSYHALLYRGTTKGQVKLHRADNSLVFSGTMEGVQPALSRLPGMLQRELRGTLESTFKGKVDVDALVVDELEMSIQFKDGEVELLQQVLGHESFPFSIAACQLTGNGRTVSILNGAVESPLFTADFQGELELKVPYQGSVISLVGTLSPRSEFFSHIQQEALVEEVRYIVQEEPIQFSVTGELGAPSISLGALSALFDFVDNGIKR